MTRKWTLFHTNVCVCVFCRTKKKETRKKGAKRKPKKRKKQIFFFLNFIIFEQNEAKFLLVEEKRRAFFFFSFLWLKILLLQKNHPIRKKTTRIKTDTHETSRESAKRDLFSLTSSLRGRLLLCCSLKWKGRAPSKALSLLLSCFCFGGVRFSISFQELMPRYTRTKIRTSFQ